MITPDKAEELIKVFTSIDGAIEYADLMHRKSDLGYWREVKRRIVNHKNHINLFKIED